MSEIVAVAEGAVAAPPAQVYTFLADFREHHPKFLPPNFADVVVVEGGHGAGTVLTFTLTLGGRTRRARSEVSEPEPGRVLAERDPDAGSLTTFTVDADGDGSRVRIETRYPRPAGVQGWIESKLAPWMLARLYRDELARLGAYARSVEAAADVGGRTSAGIV